MEETFPTTVKRWPAAWEAMGDEGRMESRNSGPNTSAKEIMDKAASLGAIL